MNLTQNPILCARTLVVNEHGQVLLVQRSQGSALAGDWELPGGKIDAGEDPRTAARRELHEETGLVVSLDPEPFCDYQGLHSGRILRAAFYRSFIQGQAKVTLNAREHSDWTWQNPERAIAYPLTESARKALGHYLASSLLSL
jgi:8-oxo-dGTP diphosphatase